MYVCKDSAAPAHARTRAHRPAAIILYRIPVFVVRVTLFPRAGEEPFADDAILPPGGRLGATLRPSLSRLALGVDRYV